MHACMLKLTAYFYKQLSLFTCCPLSISCERLGHPELNSILPLEFHKFTLEQQRLPEHRGLGETSPPVIEQYGGATLTCGNHKGVQKERVIPAHPVLRWINQAKGQEPADNSTKRKTMYVLDH